MWMVLWYQVTPFVQIIFNDFICFIASTSQYQLGGNDVSDKSLTFWNPAWKLFLLYWINWAVLYHSCWLFRDS